MTSSSILQYIAFILVVTLLVMPLGAYQARVFTGQRTWLDPLLRPLERGIYRLAGVDPSAEMTFREYVAALQLFSLCGTLLLFAVLRLQHLFPWYEASVLTTEMTWDLAVNTAISFSTATTWQAYGGETTMSYFSQIVGLAAQNFLAGAVGLAAGLAFIRGLARAESGSLGNFWFDLVRATLWILLPLALVTSLLLVWQGVPLNFSPYTSATTLEGTIQTIAQGPVAALEAPKNLGTNGGGFFNVNAAHPYETPTPLTVVLELLAIVAAPAALTYTFGSLVGRPRQGWMLYGVMVVLFSIGLVTCTRFEQSVNPAIIATSPVDYAATDGQAGGNMEGKETRFGITGSVLAAIVTSNAATGSYNSMHDSYMPLGGLVPLLNMLLGEIVFGGLGTGLYSLLLVLLLTVFITGLMVGRTPEFLGKKIGPTEVKLIAIYTLMTPVAILLPTALAVVSETGLAGLTTNAGAHGLSEILYAYTSAATNNGQSFAGLSANSPFYNLSTAISMLIGRFGLMIVALALASSLGLAPRRAPTQGTLPTDTVLFGGIVVLVAILVGGLDYFPGLALGPIAEQLQLSEVK
jgi:K+-transporting ATPase ATPase A chain